MTVPLLTSRTIEKIMSVRDMAEKYLEEGKSGAEAIALAAKEANLSKDQTHLLVRSWNISHMLDHLEREKDPIKRAQQTLPVVDFDDVLKLMEAKVTKQAGSPVWEGYNLPPEVTGLAEKVNPVQPRTIWDEYIEKGKYLDIKRQVKEAEVKFEQELKKFEKSLKLAYDEVILRRGETERVLQKLFDCFQHSGTDISLAKQHLKVANYKGYKLVCAFEKYIKPNTQSYNYLYRPDKEPYRTINQCVESLEKWAAAETGYRTLLNKYIDFRKRAGMPLPDDKYRKMLFGEPLENPGGFYPAFEIPRLFETEDIEVWAGLKKNFSGISKIAAEQSETKQEVQLHPGDPDAPPVSGEPPQQPLTASQPKSPGKPKGIKSPNKPNKTKSQLENKQNLEKHLQTIDQQSATEQKSQEGQELEGKKQKSKQTSINKQLLDFAKREAELVADLLQIRREIEPPSKEEIRGEIERKLDRTIVNDILSIIDAQAFVPKLMANSDILKQYDPEDVYDAYASLYKLAPNAMRDEVFAVAMIEKYLEQGKRLDTYDLRLMAEIEHRFIRASAPRVA